MSRFFNFLIRSNLYIAGSAFFLTLYYQYLINNNLNFAMPCFNFCLVYLAYNLLRFTPLIKKTYIKNEQSDWLSQHSTFIGTSSLISLAIVLFILTSLTLPKFILLGFSFVITLLYGKFVFGKNKLRETKYIKPLMIGLSWALICVLLPAYPTHKTSFLLFFECTLFITCLSILYDFKDINFDQSRGVKTLASHYYGNKAFIKTIFLLMAFSNILLIFMLGKNSVLSLFTLFILYFWLMQKFLKEDLSELKIHLWVDGLIYLKSFTLVFLLF